MLVINTPIVVHSRPLPASNLGLHTIPQRWLWHAITSIPFLQVRPSQQDCQAINTPFYQDNRKCSIWCVHVPPLIANKYKYLQRCNPILRKLIKNKYTSHRKTTKHSDSVSVTTSRPHPIRYYAVSKLGSTQYRNTCSTSEQVEQAYGYLPFWKTGVSNLRMHIWWTINNLASCSLYMYNIHCRVFFWGGGGRVRIV